MPLTLGDVLQEEVQYHPHVEPQMSDSEDENDRPYTPPPGPEPVARLEPMPLVPSHTPMNKTLSRLVESQVRCISCITPHEFYIRIRENEQRFKDMQNVLDELCNCFSHHPTDMRHGDQIAVYSHQHRCWCRAIFHSYNKPRVPERTRCTLLSKSKGITIRAYLTDYGYTDDSVFLFNVKGVFAPDIAPFVMKQFPILHDRCRLFNVQPFPHSGRWSDDSIRCTKNLICGKMITVVVRRVEREQNQVDVVYTEANGRHAADLALALHMADHARIPMHNDYRSNMTVSAGHPKFRPAKVPRKGDLFSGVVDYIVSPDRFFVTWASKEDELIELQKELNLFYDRPDKRETHKVSVPLLGLPCIAKYSVDNLFYRAVVSDILMDSHKVRVRFVDYGNEEEVRMDSLFNVNDKFMQTPLLVSVCCLADVRPFNTHDWSHNATDAFKRLVEESMECGHLSVRVQDVRLDDDRLHVILSKWIAGSDKSVSIAEEMVQANMARRNRQGDDDDDDLYEQLKNENIDVYKILTEVHARRVKAEMGIRDRLIDVLVFHVNSPSDMFIQLADPKIRQIFFSMSEKLDDIMSRGIPGSGSAIPHSATGKNEFDVGGWCSIQIRESWFRAKVTAKRQIQENAALRIEYDVMAVDGGYPVLNKKPSEIFLLPVQFQHHDPYAIRVSLAEISPAGGGDWLKVSTNKVIEFVSNDEYKDNLFILLNQTPPAVRPDNALPVSLVAVTKEIAGALLPEKVTYHVLNDLMAGEWGVAIGERRPRGHRFDTDILNDCSESTVCPRVSRGVVDVPFEENSLISRLQSVYMDRTAEDQVFMYDDRIPPEQQEFQALVTHVDEKMNVHFQLSHGSRIHLVNQKIIEAMKNEPLPIMQDNYLEGRACTALFDFDKTWNRAKIWGLSRFKRNHIRVSFVDYGQVEEVVAEHISSAVICRDIPPLALKASMSGVRYVRDKYEETLNELREILVDKNCIFYWQNASNFKQMKVSIRRPLSDEEKDDIAEEGDGYSDVKLWLVNKDLAEVAPDDEA